MERTTSDAARMGGNRAPVGSPAAPPYAPMNEVELCEECGGEGEVFPRHRDGTAQVCRLCRGTGKTVPPHTMSFASGTVMVLYGEDENRWVRIVTPDTPVVRGRMGLEVTMPEARQIHRALMALGFRFDGRVATWCSTVQINCVVITVVGGAAGLGPNVDLLLPPHQIAMSYDEAQQLAVCLHHLLTQPELAR